MDNELIKLLIKNGISPKILFKELEEMRKSAEECCDQFLLFEYPMIFRLRKLILESSEQ